MNHKETTDVDWITEWMFKFPVNKKKLNADDID